MEYDSMDSIDDEPWGREDPFRPLRKNPGSAQKVIHALINGKHIDPYLAEEFRFLENYPAAWEDFFEWMGYRLKKSELGGSPFFFLEPANDQPGQSRLSRGATFLGLYLAWYFFMLGPGEPDRVKSEDIFQRLVSSYPFHLLRTVFVRRTGSLSPLELSEDQAEKLRGYIRKELGELARYRFIDLRPNARAAWEDLTVHRLPALYRFWELALHVRGNNGNGQDMDIDRVVAQIWGSVEPETEEDEQ
jgi:chromosome partition protein MukE